jgi:hypothetical protein
MAPRRYAVIARRREQSEAANPESITLGLWSWIPALGHAGLGRNDGGMRRK